MWGTPIDIHLTCRIGDESNIRLTSTSRRALAEAGRRLGIHQHMFSCSNGTAFSGDHIAETVEAIIGAVYTDTADPKQKAEQAARTMAHMKLDCHPQLRKRSDFEPVLPGDISQGTIMVWNSTAMKEDRRPNATSDPQTKKDSSRKSQDVQGDEMKLGNTLEVSKTRPPIARATETGFPAEKGHTGPDHGSVQKPVIVTQQDPAYSTDKATSDPEISSKKDGDVVLPQSAAVGAKEESPLIQKR